ncbi:hypothetical protein Y032_0206g1979 [Ancylostoma ceylanicum]|uniref:Uncharacterized protein n=1 Tax=Ancylostoma ceylanicum TaxID=53326 RepID=A0A016SL18_9BILA|nr:hypothetical protein Y032_0206g1979 [Ancylostoma ceylanicum]
MPIAWVMDLRDKRAMAGLLRRQMKLKQCHDSYGYEISMSLTWGCQKRTRQTRTNLQLIRMKIAMSQQHDNIASRCPSDFLMIVSRNIEINY